MPRRWRDCLESELEDLDRIDGAHRAVALARVTADPLVELLDLGVRESGIRLGHRYQRSLIPDAEGVVGEQAGAAAIAGLRVDQHRVDGQRIDLPFPPRPFAPADAVLRVAAL